MDKAGIESLFGRIARLRERLDDKSGQQAQGWTATVDTGDVRVTISGVKDFQDIEDEMATALVWLWSMKDRVIAHAISNGQRRRWVEAEITADPVLSICADLANEQKHDSAYSHGSRSKKYPSLGSISVTVPGRAMESLSVAADSVHLSVADASKAQFSMPVLGGDGRTIGEAFSILDAAVRKWERIIKAIDDSATGRP